uniref:Membrane protein YjcL n=2 Tax=Heterosigma akashiwo TaxID=2829 RepID=A0A7S3XZE0_HETAK
MGHFVGTQKFWMFICVSALLSCNVDAFQNPVPAHAATTSAHIRHRLSFRSTNGAPSLSAPGYSITGKRSLRQGPSRVKTTLNVSPGSILSTLHGDPWYIWTALMGSATFGLWSERTKLGATLSSPLVTMAVTILMCNLGLLPSHNAAYDVINKTLVPLAVPLLLFDANIKMVLRSTGSMMAAFLLGALGTIVGTLVGARLVPLGLGEDSWKVVAALCARHIGGAVNYVAVSETVAMGPDALTAGLAADNLVIALYFSFIFWLANKAPDDGDGAAQVSNSQGGGGADDSPQVAGNQFNLLNVMKSVSFGCTLCLISSITKAFFYPGLSIIPIVSVATVAAASIAPGLFRPLTLSGGKIGVFLMQLFFAATGANGHIAKVVETAPMVFVFSVVQVALHFGVLVGGGRALGLPLRKLLLASNANVGGPTSAAAMAGAKNWHDLVLPSLLVGIFGYATATFVGLGLKGILLALCP